MGYGKYIERLDQYGSYEVACTECGENGAQYITTKYYSLGRPILLHEHCLDAFFADKDDDHDH